MENFRKPLLFKVAPLPSNILSNSQFVLTKRSFTLVRTPLLRVIVRLPPNHLQTLWNRIRKNALQGLHIPQLQRPTLSRICHTNLPPMLLHSLVLPSPKPKRSIERTTTSACIAAIMTTTSTTVPERPKLNLRSTMHQRRSSHMFTLSSVIRKTRSLKPL